METRARIWNRAGGKDARHAYSSRARTRSRAASSTRTLETVETASCRPSSRRSPHPCPRPRAIPPPSRSSSRTSAARATSTTATGERVLVEDPGGTASSRRDVRTPLPPDEDPRRWNWLTPALVFILLAALGIVLAAIVLSRDDDKKNTTTTARPNTVTTTVRSNADAAPGERLDSGAERRRPDAQPTPSARSTRAGPRDRRRHRPRPAARPARCSRRTRCGRDAEAGDTVRINVSDGQARSGRRGDVAAPDATADSARPRRRRTRRRPRRRRPRRRPTSPHDDGSERRASSTVGPPSRRRSRSRAHGRREVGRADTSPARACSATIQYVPSDEPLGTVIAQSPSAGASSQTGTHITLSVSSGPGDKEQETVPDTPARRSSRRSQTLNARRAAPDPGQADGHRPGAGGQGRRADAEAGAQAPKNAQVLVYMGAYKG